jgi:hypothetical protein
MREYMDINILNQDPVTTSENSIYFVKDGEGRLRLKVGDDEVYSADSVSKAAYDNRYSVIGRKCRMKPGILQRKRVKKIVVIGNSMTMHGPRVDIDYTVYDMREMAASRPNTGWVSLVQYEVKQLYPEVRVYRCNGATWENAALGVRNYADNLANNNALEVLDEGNDLEHPYKLHQLLGDDVDVVIVQLYENVPNVTTTADKSTLGKDYKRLWSDLKEACPNAEIFQSTGFWVVPEKTRTLMTSIGNNVKPMFISSRLSPYGRVNGTAYVEAAWKAYCEAQPGDKMYVSSDTSDMTEVATVSPTVSGHPNDAGFKAMATSALFALFNDSDIMDSNIGRDLIVWNDDPLDPRRIIPTHAEYYLPNVNSGVVNQFLNSLLIAGRYQLVTPVVDNLNSHAVLCVVNDSTSDTTVRYNRIRQEYYNDNHATIAIRTTPLSTEENVWTPWKYLAYRDTLPGIARFSITPNSVQNSSWQPCTFALVDRTASATYSSYYHINEDNTKLVIDRNGYYRITTSEYYEVYDNTVTNGVHTFLAIGVDTPVGGKGYQFPPIEGVNKDMFRHNAWISPVMRLTTGVVIGFFINAQDQVKGTSILETFEPTPPYKTSNDTGILFLEYLGS